MQRVRNGIEIFRSHDIRINLPKETDELVANLNKRHKDISLNTGKNGAKKHTKKMYRKIFRDLRKLLNIFGAALGRAEKKIGDQLPSLREGLKGLVESIEVDLHNAELCGENAKSRVLKEKQIPAAQKVLGISDQDAAMLPKGNRPLVFGYKPQIGRSDKGFIVSALIPPGNAADSDQMRPITDEAIHNTGILPAVLSYDDGYTNKKSREHYLGQGVGVVSFGGAKGKAQITEWDDRNYEEARRRRSLAESTMSLLKGTYDLDRFSRRGLERVTQELLTAVIFHNTKLLGQLT